jgi:integrase
MTKFEVNQIDVRGDGKVILYQRPDHKVKKWQARISVEGASGYARFSTKMSDSKDAERVALDKYFELKNKVDKGGSLRGKTVKQTYEEWLEYLPLVSMDKSEDYINDTTSKVKRVCVDYFKSKPIGDITNTDAQEMMGEYVRSKELASSTIRGTRAALNLFFKFAVDRDYLKTLPSIPVPSLKKNPRPEFTKDEWNKLTTFLRKWVEEPCKGGRGMNGYDAKRHRERFYLQHYVLIMGNTGIRVGEMRNVRWIDLDKVEVTGGEQRLLFSVDGKTGKRDVIANAGTERYIRRLYEYRRDELGKTDNTFDRTEFIFCHPNGNRIGTYRGSFETLLKDTELRKDKNGNNRTLYSIRHTYATMRINEVPIYQLAVNMGTSVEMIEDYYSHAKVRDKEFASSMTKGNQKGSSKALPF